MLREPKYSQRMDGEMKQKLFTEAKPEKLDPAR
jgi:hypothetical protein